MASPHAEHKRPRCTNASCLGCLDTLEKEGCVPSSRLVMVSLHCHFADCTGRGNCVILDKFDRLFGTVCCSSCYAKNFKKIVWALRNNQYSRQCIPSDNVVLPDGGESRISVLRSSGVIEHNWSLLTDAQFQGCQNAGFPAPVFIDPSLNNAIVVVLCRPIAPSEQKRLGSNGLILKGVELVDVLRNNPEWRPTLTFQNDIDVSTDTVQLWSAKWSEALLLTTL